MFRKVEDEIHIYNKEEIKMCLVCKEKHCKGECYKIRKLRREQENDRQKANK